MRDDFPFIAQQPTLTYLDSAATSQLPRSVIEAVTHHLENSNANIHRGQYTISLTTTAKYEQTRGLVADFLQAGPEYDVIFTSGTTAAIAQIIFGLQPLIKKENRVVVLADNHHSNFVGWQRLCLEREAVLDVVPVNRNGRVSLPRFKQALVAKPAVVALSHVSNVTGVIHPIQELCALAKRAGSLTVIDGAQAVAHTEVDLNQLQPDFYVFSGHKLFAPTGTGVLIGRHSLLAKMEPLITGGGMISHVTREQTSWAPLPQKLEAGTPNIVGVIGLSAALTWLKEHPVSLIAKHEEVVTRALLAELAALKPLRVIGPASTTDRVGVISLAHPTIHAHDIAEVLAGQNIATRAGHHCAQTLHQQLGVTATVRISVGPYTDMADIDRLVAGLKIAMQKLG